MVDGNDVTDQTVEYPLNQSINIRIEANGGYVLDNWNNGQWFEDDWEYVVTEDANITAYLSEE